MAKKTEKKPQAAIWTVTTHRGLNLRAEPGGAILAVLPIGTEVKATEQDGAWFKVKVDTKTTGWVMAEYLSRKEDAE